ncbi:hypothetical protein EMCRGX_G027354 [Ephydatia muelleri]
MSYVVSWKNLQSLVATTGRLAHRTNVHPRYPYWHRRQFLSAVVPVVQNEEAGQPLQRRRLHAEAHHEPRYPPRTFRELMVWSCFVLYQSRKCTFTPILPAPVTLLANNIPIMVDARANMKTLTWPADPFDLAHFDSNTTAYFHYVPISKRANDITCRLYTPAFKQYTSSKIQQYILAVVEQGGSYVVKFVNEASLINAGIYTDIILEGNLSENIQVSMRIVAKDNANVYLKANTSGKSTVVTTSTDPAAFVMTFYNLY